MKSGEGFKKARQFLALEPLDDEARDFDCLGVPIWGVPKPKTMGVVCRVRARAWSTLPKIAWKPDCHAIEKGQYELAC